MCRVSAWYNEQRTQKLAHRREVRIRRNKLKKIRSKANVARFVFFFGFRRSLFPRQCVSICDNE